MTRKELERLNRQSDTLRSLGFTQGEAEQLRRISMTLHRWFELECGDGYSHIERDEKTGKPYRYNDNARYLQANDPRRGYAVADREAGARKRLVAIIDARNKRNWPEAVTPYVQTDPRGAALYILRPGDVPAGENADSYYSRGVCVY